MKKYFQFLLIGLAATLMLPIKSNSQTSENKTFKYVEPPKTLTPNTAINAKAVKIFNRRFKDVKDVQWFNGKDLIQASFSKEGKMNRVYYRPNGSWFRTLTTYDGNQLPKFLKNAIKKSYPKHSIVWVTEVRENGLFCYFVNIETAEDFKQILIYQNELFEHQSYQKM